MRPLDFVAQRPLLVLGLVAAGFLAWVVADTVRPPEKSNPPPAAIEAPMTADMKRMHSIGTALHALQPGMLRAEVEQQLGPPAPRDIRPIERANGRVVYRTHYPAYLELPLMLSPHVRGYCEAVLEYDASSPGHPLLRVTAIPRGGPVTPSTFAAAV